jgi:hypothetical protein
MPQQFRVLALLLRLDRHFFVSRPTSLADRLHQIRTLADFKLGQTTRPSEFLAKRGSRKRGAGGSPHRAELPPTLPPNYPGLARRARDLQGRPRRKVLIDQHSPALARTAWDDPNALRLPRFNSGRGLQRNQRLRPRLPQPQIHVSVSSVENWPVPTRAVAVSPLKHSLREIANR